MALVTSFGNRVNPNCLVSGGVKKAGCKVKMEDAPKPRLVIDFDKPGAPLKPPQALCDYLFVADGNDGADWIAPLARILHE